MHHSPSLKILYPLVIQHSYGTSPCFMENLAIVHSYVKLPKITCKESVDELSYVLLQLAIWGSAPFSKSHLGKPKKGNSILLIILIWVRQHGTMFVSVECQVSGDYPMVQPKKHLEYPIIMC